MRIIDITRLLSEKTPVYPGDTEPVFIQEEHDWYRVSSLHLGSHTGTHIDAPSHCIGFNDTIDTIPIDNLIGKCRVIDARTAGPVISASFLHGKLGTSRRILLKTDSPVSDCYSDAYPALSSDAADLLVSHRIRCIGTDAPSVEPAGDEGTVHRILLGSGCSIIEFLDLAHVPPGTYTQVALPLRLAGLDGSPARVVLLKDNGCE
jgi:arylformamidase